MGSDIGHWDVPRFDEPLEEAYEMLERGILDEEALRDFLFTYPVRFLTEANPDFFVAPRSRPRCRRSSAPEIRRVDRPRLRRARVGREHPRHEQEDGRR